MKLTGAAILVSRGMKVFRAAPAAYPYRSGISELPMGTALYPILEKKIKGLDPSLEVSGKALSRHAEMIDVACKALGIKTVWDFYDESPEEVQDHLAEDMSPELEKTLKAQPLKWSDASEGVAWVQALRSQLAKQSDVAAKAVIDDLNALERVLARAVKEKSRFRLALDI
jgi:hypothetical protein